MGLKRLLGGLGEVFFWGFVKKGSLKGFGVVLGVVGRIIVVVVVVWRIVGGGGKKKS